MVTETSSRFSIKRALKVGWERFLANIGPMALYALVVWVLSFLLNAPNRPDSAIGSLLLGLVSLIVGQLIALGWVRIALDAVDGRRVSVDSIAAGFRLLIPYAIAAIIYSVAVAVGLILLIVPGIIVAIMWCFYGFIIVDRGVDPMTALRRSAELTRGERLHLFGFGLVLLGLNILGLLLFIVGVLVTSAVSQLAIASVYRQLESSGTGSSSRQLA